MFLKRLRLIGEVSMLASSVSASEDCETTSVPASRASPIPGRAAPSSTKAALLISARRVAASGLPVMMASPLVSVSVRLGLPHERRGPAEQGAAVADDGADHLAGGRDVLDQHRALARRPVPHGKR